MLMKVVIFTALCGLAVAHMPVMHEVQHHAAQPYKFGYNVKDKHGDQYREETGDGHSGVKGSYGFTDARGVKRQVDYVADHAGFRAQVKTNEPGTANQNPAAVKMISDAPYAGGMGYGYDLENGVYGNGYDGYGLENGIYGNGYGLENGVYGNGYDGYGLENGVYRNGYGLENGIYGNGYGLENGVYGNGYGGYGPENGYGYKGYGVDGRGYGGLGYDLGYGGYGLGLGILGGLGYARYGY